MKYRFERTCVERPRHTLSLLQRIRVDRNRSSKNHVFRLNFITLARILVRIAYTDRDLRVMRSNQLCRIQEPIQRIVIQLFTKHPMCMIQLLCFRCPSPKLCYHAEEAHSTPPRRPEQICIFVAIADSNFSIRGNDLNLHKPAISRHSPSLHEISLSPRKKKSAETDGWGMSERKK